MFFVCNFLQSNAHLSHDSSTYLLSLLLLLHLLNDMALEAPHLLLLLLGQDAHLIH